MSSDIFSTGLLRLFSVLNPKTHLAAGVSVILFLNSVASDPFGARSATSCISHDGHTKPTGVLQGKELMTRSRYSPSRKTCSFNLLCPSSIAHLGPRAFGVLNKRVLPSSDHFDVAIVCIQNYL